MEYLIVGLGNIGAEYASTRHNIGFMVLDAFAKAFNTIFLPTRYGEVAEVSWKGRKIALLKPSTYMNLSGKAVRYHLQHRSVPNEHLVVISDDLNLPFGKIRMRERGSAGGHNGLQNIADLLETEDWARIRVGIGNDFNRGAQINFVLGDLSEEELATVSEVSSRIIEGVKILVTQGPERAMNFLNTAPKTEEKQEKSEKSTN
ncbi:MAG: aminoacyl-tRNA hydrolase [Bacteroidales bacterium]|nr:aminoacyl-tRNA hydrolase [Bacteroidales bacterium]